MSTVGKEGKSVTKYSKEFSIPPEFPDILRDLTREILRSQPKDINKFGTSAISLFTTILSLYQVSLIF